MSLQSEEAGNSATAQLVPAVPPLEPTLASVLHCMVMLQRQHNQSAEAVQRLTLPGQSTLPIGTQASILPATTPMDQTSSPSDAGIGGSPSSIPAVTFSVYLLPQEVAAVSCVVAYILHVLYAYVCWCSSITS